MKAGITIFRRYLYGPRPWSIQVVTKDGKSYIDHERERPSEILDDAKKAAKKLGLKVTVSRSDRKDLYDPEKEKQAVDRMKHRIKMDVLRTGGNEKEVQRQIRSWVTRGGKKIPIRG